VPVDEAPLFYVVETGCPTCIVQVLPDGAGAFALPAVPAGKGSFRRLEQAGEEVRWAPVRELDLEPGETRRVDL
jgi:hypothetical protein